jgi:hypothetical protein
MTSAARSRGAVPVGVCTHLPPVEGGAVRALRLWFSGAEGRAEMAARFARRFGAEAGGAHLDRLGRFLETLAGSCRRPLMRHGIGCACLGADECVLATLLAAAGEGDRDEAMLLACVLVRADRAGALVAEAEALAPLLGCLAPPAEPGADPLPPGPPAGATRH